MRGRVCWAVGLFVIALRCASAPLPRPTPQRPVAMCSISCPEGFAFRQQHQCRGKRWFQDILAVGEKTERGVDGTVTLAVWITRQGDYAKVDVERGSCSSVVHSIVMSRSAEQRGQFPGETFDGHVSPP